jgi:hypothetical protein
MEDVLIRTDVDVEVCCLNGMVSTVPTLSYGYQLRKYVLASIGNQKVGKRRGSF